MCTVVALSPTRSARTLAFEASALGDELAGRRRRIQGVFEGVANGLFMPMLKPSKNTAVVAWLDSGGLHNCDMDNLHLRHGRKDNERIGLQLSPTWSA